MPTIDADNIVDKYVQLRDRASEIKKRQQEEMAPYNEAMQKLEDMLLAHMLELNADSIKTPHGTAYQKMFTSVKVGDWEATLAFIRQQDLWHMLEKRVSKQAVDEYVTETGNLPPGVDIAHTKTVNIRRS